MNKDKSESHFGYLLAGVGIGTIVGILAAPWSGEEMREFIRQRAEEGREYAENAGRQIRECGKNS